MTEPKIKIDYKEIERRRKALDWFNNAQLTKLLENAYKGNWENCSDQYLLQRLEEETIELKKAIIAGNHQEIVRECADVSIFAMAIASKYK